MPDMPENKEKPKNSPIVKGKKYRQLKESNQKLRDENRAFKQELEFVKNYYQKLIEKYGLNEELTKKQGQINSFENVLRSCKDLNNIAQDY